MKPFSEMTDNEFKDYLKSKYGDDWFFTSLTPEEWERCPTISEDDLKKALEQGREERDRAEGIFR